MVIHCAAILPISSLIHGRYEGRWPLQGNDIVLWQSFVKSSYYLIPFLRCESHRMNTSCDSILKDEIIQNFILAVGEMVEALCAGSAKLGRGMVGVSVGWGMLGGKT
jgi:hypothetical protein